LNNIIEQDHRFIERRIAASLGFRSAAGAWRAIEGYEAMHLFRKGRSRGCPKATKSGCVNSSIRCSVSPLDFLSYAIASTESRISLSCLQQIRYKDSLDMADDNGFR
jgi:hypothetical protein